MTEPFDEYGDRLRRALHAEAEAVAPSPEGLEEIHAKIERQRERRLWYTRPWLRPLVALSAAVAVAIIAVPGATAFKNFVQTGHFTPDTGQGGGGQTAEGRYTQNPRRPGPAKSGTRFSPRPSASLSMRGGSHVVPGGCPADAPRATPAGTPSGSPSAKPSPSPTAPRPSGSAERVTCEPSTSSVSPSAHAPDAPTDSDTTQPPASTAPTGGSQPSVQSSP